MSQKIDRTGEVSYTKYGTKATIIKYENNKNVLIEFDDEYKYRYYVSYINFKNKRFRGFKKNKFFFLNVKKVIIFFFFAFKIKK